MRFPTMWYVRPAKPQTSLRIRAVWSEPMLVAWRFYECELLTDNHLEFLSLKGVSSGLSGPVHAKMPHFLKFHVTAQFIDFKNGVNFFRGRPFRQHTFVWPGPLILYLCDLFMVQ